jgi:hypothetical protein
VVTVESSADEARGPRPGAAGGAARRTARGARRAAPLHGPPPPGAPPAARACPHAPRACPPRAEAAEAEANPPRPQVGNNSCAKYQQLLRLALLLLNGAGLFTTVLFGALYGITNNCRREKVRKTSS